MPRSERRSSRLPPGWGGTAATLYNWIRQAERDPGGLREGLNTSEREKIMALERARRELRLADQFLRKASAYFAQAELDRRPQK